MISLPIAIDYSSPHKVRAINIHILLKLQRLLHLERASVLIQTNGGWFGDELKNKTFPSSHLIYQFYQSYMEKEEGLIDSYSQSSRKRAEEIFQEEEQTSEAFHLQHFYDRKELNLKELKTRLNVYKKDHRNSPEKRLKTHSPILKLEDCETAKFGNFQGEEGLKKSTRAIKKNIDNKPIHRAITNYSQPQSQRHHMNQLNLLNSSSKWANKQQILNMPRQSGWQNQSKTTYRPGNIRVPNTYRYSTNKRINTLTQQQDYSKCSQSSLLRSIGDEGLEGRIKVTSKGQLLKLQKKIQILWGHYQMITKILIQIRGNLSKNKEILAKYSQLVSSQQFQFIKEVFSELLSQNIKKSELISLKRLSRSIVLSRIFENLTIIYVAMFICFRTSLNAHLTNCLGYSSSSVAFIIKFIVLMHSLESPLRFSPTIQAIVQTIQQYQKGTFGSRISKIDDVGLRLEQNNEVMTIVQGKLSQMMDHQFQETVSGLLKNVDLDTKPFFEYSNYIFEFLAFHLASMKMFGQLPGLEMPPAPYFTSFPKKRTLVIEPWGVLFAKKDKSTFLRAHAQHFLNEISQHWNIVYWSDLMPKDVEDLLQRLPPGRSLFRYHCLYNEGLFVKCLDRIGCNVHDTFIIDRSVDNFYYNKDSGLMLPWRAQRKDTKLLELLELLRPMFSNEEASVPTFIGLIRTKLAGIIKKGQQSRKLGEGRYPMGLNRR